MPPTFLVRTRSLQGGTDRTRTLDSVLGVFLGRSYSGKPATSPRVQDGC